jgi:hypothetical protein
LQKVADVVDMMLDRNGGRGVQGMENATGDIIYRTENKGSCTANAFKGGEVTK